MIAARLASNFAVGPVRCSQVGAGQLRPEDAPGGLGRGGHHPPVGADGGRLLFLDVAEVLDVDGLDRLGGLARNGKANLLCRVGRVGAAGSNPGSHRKAR